MLESQQQQSIITREVQPQSDQHGEPQRQQDIYQRIKLLGTGSFGKAFLVKQVKTGQLYVIKQINMVDLDPNQQENARKQAKILEMLDHPNIVKFKQTYATAKMKLNIVMEYCAGGDLAARIKDAKLKSKYFDEADILNWFTQICLGIKHIHDRKIIHRDLKGQNIFLTDNDIVKIGDFGVARILEHTIAKAKTVVGSPYYLSPEIIENRPYSAKTDIWSLGALLFQMCALQPPFTANNLQFLALKIVKGSYPQLPPQYSSDLKMLIKSMLNTNPNTRPNINQILSSPLLNRRIKLLLTQSQNMKQFSHTVLHKFNVLKGEVQDRLGPPPNLMEIQQEKVDGGGEKNRVQKGQQGLLEVKAKTPYCYGKNAPPIKKKFVSEKRIKQNTAQDLAQIMKIKATPLQQHALPPRLPKMLTPNLAKKRPQDRPQTPKTNPNPNPTGINPSNMNININVTSIQIAPSTNSQNQSKNLINNVIPESNKPREESNYNEIKSDKYSSVQPVINKVTQLEPKAIGVKNLDQRNQDKETVSMTNVIQKKTGDKNSKKSVTPVIFSKKKSIDCAQYKKQKSKQKQKPKAGTKIKIKEQILKKQNKSNQPQQLIRKQKQQQQQKFQQQKQQQRNQFIFQQQIPENYNQSNINIEEVRSNNQYPYQQGQQNQYQNQFIGQCQNQECQEKIQEQNSQERNESGYRQLNNSNVNKQVYKNSSNMSNNIYNNYSTPLQLDNISQNYTGIPSKTNPNICIENNLIKPTKQANPLLSNPITNNKIKPLKSNPRSLEFKKKSNQSNKNKIKDNKSEENLAGEANSHHFNLKQVGQEAIGGVPKIAKKVVGKVSVSNIISKQKTKSSASNNPNGVKNPKSSNLELVSQQLKQKQKQNPRGQVQTKQNRESKPIHPKRTKTANTNASSNTPQTIPNSKRAPIKIKRQSTNNANDGSRNGRTGNISQECQTQTENFFEGERDGEGRGAGEIVEEEKCCDLGADGYEDEFDVYEEIQDNQYYNIYPQQNNKKQEQQQNLSFQLSNSSMPSPHKAHSPTNPTTVSPNNSYQKMLAQLELINKMVQQANGKVQNLPMLGQQMSVPMSELSGGSFVRQDDSDLQSQVSGSRRAFQFSITQVGMDGDEGKTQYSMMKKKQNDLLKSLSNISPQSGVVNLACLTDQSQLQNLRIALQQIFGLDHLLIIYKHISEIIEKYGLQFNEQEVIRNLLALPLLNSEKRVDQCLLRRHFRLIVTVIALENQLMGDKN